jgi:hypothetical protein
VSSTDKKLSPSHSHRIKYPTDISNHTQITISIQHEHERARRARAWWYDHPLPQRANNWHSHAAGSGSTGAGVERRPTMDVACSSWKIFFSCLVCWGLLQHGCTGGMQCLDQNEALFRTYVHGWDLGGVCSSSCSNLL